MSILSPREGIYMEYKLVLHSPCKYEMMDGAFRRLSFTPLWLWMGIWWVRLWLS